MSFSAFALLSFASALARSDEAHLWYGSVWLSVFIVYSVYVLLSKKFLLQTLRAIIPISIAFWAVGVLLIKLKTASIFILLVLLLFVLSKRNKKLQFLSYEIALAGLIASLIVFHSLSFIKLRFLMPIFSLQTSFSPNLFKSDQGEIAGLQVKPETLTKLIAINKHLDKRNHYLFIYPDNIYYYSYFSYKNPSRHYYHAGETTEKLQREIVGDLERTKTINFLVFPKRVTYKGLVWNWILKNTHVDSRYTIEGQEAELRKIKP